MIIARATTDHGELLILGLSAINVTRMMAGKPIVIREKTHGEGVPKGWEIMIFTGETEVQMQDALQKAGVIGPETKINVDPKLGKDSNS